MCDFQGAKMRAVIVAGMMVAGLAFAGTAGASPELAKSSGCMNCHAVGEKKVGPAFKDVAAKYKDNKDAEAKVTAELKDGKGHPVKVSATDAELKTLVEYALSAK